MMKLLPPFNNYLDLFKGNLYSFFHSMNVMSTIIPIPIPMATISSSDCHSFVFSSSSGITDTVAI